MKIFPRKSLLVALSLLSIGHQAIGAESPWSLNVLGLSWHENEAHRKVANQINPGAGLRYDLSRNWYTEINYISKNSTGGATTALGFGWHTEATKVLERPLLLGLQITLMRYDVPGYETKIGALPSFTGMWKINKTLSLVGNVFPKPNDSVLVLGVNVAF